jgi:hypothetical protein
MHDLSDEAEKVRAAMVAAAKASTEADPVTFQYIRGMDRSFIDLGSQTIATTSISVFHEIRTSGLIEIVNESVSFAVFYLTRLGLG